MTVHVNLAVEDRLSELVARKMLELSPKELRIHLVFGLEGYGYLRKKAGSFNQASKGTPYLLLTDLDANPCPPTLIREWVDHPLAPNFLFRVAVREVEAWLLADRENISPYLGVPLETVPEHVETVVDPKELLIGLARRSKRRAVRSALVPQGTARQGPDHNGFLGRFVTDSWDLQSARTRSHSLHRALRRIENDWPGST